MSGVARGRGVAVTGMGLITPAGIGVAENWRRVLSGVSAGATDPELKGEKVDISCRVPGFDPTAELGRRTAWKLDRFTQLAVVGARQAVADSGLDTGSWDCTRVGVVIGNSLGGAATLEKQLRINARCRYRAGTQATSQDAREVHPTRAAGHSPF
ncbi:beta-ketoacyl synthase N-terminal-like domain-containing protein, partial [Streptomyces sp. NPDC001027]|uniref:beta-ketoacyl synthase N-terminal-like domain-containing protein n=1 Tax=Streptomyces sp. NPDC001027 TaxID=3154771 RepID=UPI00331AF45D